MAQKLLWREWMKLKSLLVLILLWGLFSWRPAYAQSLESLEAPSVETSQKLAIVTHPCGKDVNDVLVLDHLMVARDGANALVRFANEHEIPTVILNGCNTYIPDELSTMKYYSESGELSFEFSAKEVYVAGGYFGWCLDKTVNDVLWQFSKMSQNRDPSMIFTIYMVADAIYQLDFLEEKSWVPSSYLLKDDLDRYDEEALRYWATGWVQLRAFYFGMPNFEINVDVYGQPAFHRAATSTPSHTLNIHFIDSSQLN
ncbi:MAG TPA: hypothetical protein VJB34_03390 [Bdellovibrionota bacterium]|nr:hypothetical protein [Bdellovibrionota bacterium]